MTMTPVAPITSPAAAPAAAASSASRYGFGDDGFTFGDFLDIINPLQHIPIVGTIYRAITGDTMEAGSEIAGGALYGGPIGALLSVADVAFTESTGKPIDRTMLGWVGLDGSDSKPTTAVAQNTPAAVHPSVHTTATVAAASPAMPAHVFPAATRRIVPLANYPQPAPPAPPQPAATAAPQRIAPMLIEPSPTAAPKPDSAGAAPAANPSPAAPTTTAAASPDLEGAQALLAALRDSGVDPASAARAANAYRASLAIPVRQPEPGNDSVH